MTWLFLGKKIVVGGLFRPPYKMVRPGLPMRPLAALKWSLARLEGVLWAVANQLLKIRIFAKKPCQVFF